MSERMELIYDGEVSGYGKSLYALIPGDQVKVLGLKKGDRMRVYRETTEGRVRLIIEFPKPGDKKPSEFD